MSRLLLGLGLLVVSSILSAQSIEVTADDTSYTVFKAAEGVHTFQISTVEDGLEGDKSPAVSALVLAPIEIVISKPAYPSLTVRVVE